MHEARPIPILLDFSLLYRGDVSELKGKWKGGRAASSLMLSAASPFLNWQSKVVSMVAGRQEGDCRASGSGLLLGVGHAHPLFSTC